MPSDERMPSDMPIWWDRTGASREKESLVRLVFFRCHPWPLPLKSFAAVEVSATVISSGSRAAGATCSHVRWVRYGQRRRARVCLPTLGAVRNRGCSGSTRPDDAHAVLSHGFSKVQLQRFG